MRFFYKLYKMYILTDDDIKILCTSYTDLLPNYDSIVQDYFTLLYNTGCRSDEPLIISRWSLHDDDKVQLRPFKGNESRVFPNRDIPASFRESINPASNYFNIYSADKYNYIFNTFNPYGKLLVENKAIRTYLFRYNKVRMLRTEGYSFAEITTMFGWTNSGIVTGYASQDIYTNSI